MLRISCSRPTKPPQNIYTPNKFTSMKQKATGSPNTIMTIRVPIISRSANCHSNDIHLVIKVSFVTLVFISGCSPLPDVCAGSSQELDEEQATTYRDNNQDGVYGGREYCVKEITSLKIVPSDLYTKPGKGQANDCADNGGYSIKDGFSSRT